MPNKGAKGKREWARTIKMDQKVAEAEASQSADPDGDMGNAPTRQDTKFSIGHANRDGKSIRAAVESLQKRAKNAAPLKIVNTFAELPEHIKTRYREREMTGGVRGVNDGQKVYIVADAVESVDQAVSLGSTSRECITDCAEWWG